MMAYMIGYTLTGEGEALLEAISIEELYNDFYPALACVNEALDHFGYPVPLNHPELGSMEVRAHRILPIVAAM